MSISKQTKKELQAYYNAEGIVPGDRFACKNKDICPDYKDYVLERGMQCHVGDKYGEKIRILVASLDCGGGGADLMDDRQKNVVNGASKPLNPHMRGTYQALSYFLEDDPAKWIHPEPSNLVHYMVMTNTCKCCKKGSTSQMGYKYFWNCRDHTLAEISIIKPQVILFQGKNSIVGCQDMLSPIEGIENPEISERLRVFHYKDLTCYAVLCIHPSARGRQYKKRAHFYTDTLPEIAKFIKKDSLHILPPYNQISLP